MFVSIEKRGWWVGVMNGFWRVIIGIVEWVEI